MAVTEMGISVRANPSIINHGYKYTFGGEVVPSKKGEDKELNSTLQLSEPTKSLDSNFKEEPNTIRPEIAIQPIPTPLLNDNQVQEIVAILEKAKSSLPSAWDISTNKYNSGWIRIHLWSNLNSMPAVPKGYKGKEGSYFFKNHEEVEKQVEEKFKTFGLLRSEYEISYWEGLGEIDIAVEPKNPEIEEFKRMTADDLIAKAIKEMVPKKESDWEGFEKMGMIIKMALQKDPQCKLAPLAHLYTALCLFYLRPGDRRTIKAELLEANTLDKNLYDMEKDTLYQYLWEEAGSISTSEELDKMKEFASKYKPSKFIEEYFAVQVECGADPKQIEIAKIELGYLVGEIGKILKEKKPQSSEDTLNIIHDYVHNVYRFNFADQNSLVDGLVDHRFDCDIISMIFYEVGQQYNLPIKMRKMWGYPQNHVFISWERDDSSRLLWEPLAKGDTPRIYIDDKDLVDRISQLQSIQPVVSRSISFSANSALSDAYLYYARDVSSRIQLIEALCGGKSLEPSDELVIKKGQLIKRALALDPYNLAAYILSGKPEKAIKAASTIGGPDLKKYISALLHDSKK